MILGLLPECWANCCDAICVFEIGIILPCGLDNISPTLSRHFERGLSTYRYGACTFNPLFPKLYTGLQNRAIVSNVPVR